MQCFRLDGVLCNQKYYSVVSLVGLSALYTIVQCFRLDGVLCNQKYYSVVSLVGLSALHSISSAVSLVELSASNTTVYCVWLD